MRLPLLAALPYALASLSLARPPAPTDLVCDWQPSPATVTDPLVHFAWEAPAQAEYQVVVRADPAEMKVNEGDLLSTGWVASRVGVCEHNGPPLKEGRTYLWRVRIRDADGKAGPFTDEQRFTYTPRELPHRLPHIRTFVNFGAKPDVVASRYDLTFRSDAKQFRPEVIALNYSLLCTMVIPSEKAEALERFCVEEGLTNGGILEDTFVHFARDTQVTLHVGAERAENPRETRTVPGWNRADGANATARERAQARVPIYYWGPPNDDYVMNVGDPRYQQFCAEVYVPSRLEGFDGVWIDTMTSHVPGPRGEILEYPNEGPEADKWREDMLRMLCTIKRSLRDTLFLANGWDSQPFVIDGVEHENWLNIATPLSRYEATLASAAERERRGIIQMLQVNPVYDPETNEFGVKADVDPDRDRLFALATYYLIAGDRTYFGYGQHPYRRSEEKWFPAIGFDVGKPIGERYVFAEQAGDAGGANLLPNGDFEQHANGKPDGWTLLDPVAIDTEVFHGGAASVRTDSTSTQINNINKQYVTLKPHTTYTLSAWVKTQHIAGGQGAQVYPYEFDGATGADIAIVAQGTRDWTRLMQVFRTADDAEGRINFRIFGSTGTAWFDDLRLVEGSFGDWRVLARDFERALVLVKPFVGSFGDDTATIHDLPAPMRPLRADGSLGEPTSQVTLRSGEAAILVR
jgi:hypothetical protein